MARKCRLGRSRKNAERKFLLQKKSMGIVKKGGLQRK